MPPLIKRPAGHSGWKLGATVVLGVIGGIYIWKPAFEQFWSLEENKKQRKPAAIDN